MMIARIEFKQLEGAFHWVTIPETSKLITAN